MTTLTIQVAIDLAAKVDGAARALNEAMHAAAIAGLVVELETFSAQQIGAYGSAVVQAVAKVKPSDIKREENV